MTTTEFYLSQVISGIATGCTYGLLALAIVFIYRTAKVGSFMQADMATLSVYFMFTLMAYIPGAAAFVLALLASFMIGGAVHVLIIRKVRNTEKMDMELIEVIITVGLAAMLNSLIRWTWGSRLLPFPSPFSDNIVQIGTIATTYHSIGVIVTTMAIAFGLWFFFKHTRIGLASEAISNNRLAAATRGIHIHRMLALSWGLAAVIGGISGVLAAPILNLHPSTMANVFMYAFIAAIIGGLKSPLGALFSGIFVGIAENLAGTIETIGSELKTVVVFMILVVVLYVKPRGLFGKKEVRKV